MENSEKIPPIRGGFILTKPPVSNRHCSDSSGSLPDAEALAKRFHETYERLAPQYAYKTQVSSAVDWADVPSCNKRLMIAVCAEILAENSKAL
jgi:hypothetical protein